MAQQTQRPKKTTKKQPAASKAAAKPEAAQAQSAPGLSPEQRQQRIAEAAYLIAEQRGFGGNRELDDWLQAEAEVDARSAPMH